MLKFILLSIMALLLFTGCNDFTRIILPVEQGRNYENKYTNNERNYANQPPAHAKAYGRRARSSHTYNYYPSAEFYFDLERKMYFYLSSSGEWSFSMNLPNYLRSHLQNDYVKIEMEDDRPYINYEDHKKKYKYKKKRKDKKYKDKGKGKGKKHDKKKNKKKSYEDYNDEYEDRYEDEEDNRRKGRRYERE